MIDIYIYYMINDILWIICASITGALPVLLIKQYINKENYKYLMLAILSYLILFISYINIYKCKYNISSVQPIISILQLFIIILISIIVFGEYLNRTKISGILCGFLAIYLLS